MVKKLRSIKIFNPDTGKTHRLDSLIFQLGVTAVAERYKVSKSTVKKWLYGIHRPAVNTLTRSKKLF